MIEIVQWYISMFLLGVAIIMAVIGNVYVERQISKAIFSMLFAIFLLLLAGFIQLVT